MIAWSDSQRPGLWVALLGSFFEVTQRFEGTGWKTTMAIKRIKFHVMVRFFPSVQTMHWQKLIYIYVYVVHLTPTLAHTNWDRLGGTPAHSVLTRNRLFRFHQLLVSMISMFNHLWNDEWYPITNMFIRWVDKNQSDPFLPWIKETTGRLEPIQRSQNWRIVMDCPHWVPLW